MFNLIFFDRFILYVCSGCKTSRRLDMCKSLIHNISNLAKTFEFKSTILVYLTSGDEGPTNVIVFMFYNMIYIMKVSI